ncbi:MAG: histidine kinase [Agriterribacter sp.]
MRCSVIICYTFFLVLGLPSALSAQDSTYNKKSRSSKVGKAAESLRKSLSTDNELQIAKEYETLGEELINKGDYTKGEAYLNKAKDIYNRLGKKNEEAAVLRTLAKAQEFQKKIAPAIKNYQFAAQQALDTTLEKVNLNDANRLRTVDPQEQQTLAQKNAVIFTTTGKNEEAADAYKQVAESQIKQNNTTGALENLKIAIEFNPDPKKAASISNKMAEVYVSNNQISQAITLAENVLAESKKSNDIAQQIEQLQLLSKLHQQNNNYQRAGLLLQDAYDLSVTAGNTSKAKNSALLLATFYKEQHKSAEANRVYQTFLTNLDSIIKRDSSLIDARLFEITEERIKELEKEKVLQNELMQKKNRFNYFLLGSIVLMGLLLFFIMRALQSIRIKNKKIALQSLRREMNPHFIFNSLNSVNQYIAENKELEANKYLTSYSSLMRNVMENSGKDLVTLTVETDQLKKYLELEHQRFSEKFDYTIVLDKEIDTDMTLIPNMLIQPHIENAVWHGLRYKEGKGKLQLSFLKKGALLEVAVTDDGIGIAKSRLLKTDNQKKQQSRGIDNTKERIDLLNKIYKTNISMKVEEINDEGATGTRVTISIPVITKK